MRERRDFGRERRRTGQDDPVFARRPRLCGFSDLGGVFLTRGLSGGTPLEVRSAPQVRAVFASLIGLIAQYAVAGSDALCRRCGLHAGLGAGSAVAFVRERCACLDLDGTLPCAGVLDVRIPGGSCVGRQVLHTKERKGHLHGTRGVYKPPTGVRCSECLMCPMRRPMLWAGLCPMVRWVSDAREQNRVSDAPVRCSGRLIRLSPKVGNGLVRCLQRRP